MTRAGVSFLAACVLAAALSPDAARGMPGAEVQGLAGPHATETLVALVEHAPLAAVRAPRAAAGIAEVVIATVAMPRVEPRTRADRRPDVPDRPVRRKCPVPRRAQVRGQGSRRPQFPAA